MIKQLTGIVICTCTCILSFSQQVPPGNTYALVIGVSKYLDPGIPQLQYAHKDAIIFAEYLRSKAGGSVPPENIRLLVDSAANTGAVHDAVYWLKKSCKKDDRVIIYFSGHGDLENITMYNNGFLICYDSPPFNYVRLALSIDYLNDIANTLSLEKQAQVILITDACHSGKLQAGTFKGNFLAAAQLRKTRSREIRITSSSADQLSNEKPDWGGGRGVFSYYLVNGLKGLARRSNTGFITLNDLKFYLDSALSNDMILKQDSAIQTASIQGNGNYVLAQVDSSALRSAEEEIRQDTLVQRLMLTRIMQGEDEDPAEYFYTLVKNAGPEELTNRYSLHEVAAAGITSTLIDSLTYVNGNEVHRAKLTALKEGLASGRYDPELFNNRLATVFDEAGQRVITQYLRGDAAELERRRYYNANYSEYDVYPRMFRVALKLTTPANLYYYNNLMVKLHYFTGVAARLKIPLTAVRDQAALVETALSEQKKALALEQYGAYIYNELGVLYSYKRNDALALKYFKIAALRAPSWAIPRYNLADLYTEKGDLEKAMLYADSALLLQPGSQDIYISYGLIHEKKGNLLLAEEAYQKSIKLNSRHFLPFERLGYVYLANQEFAAADSMFFEAAERKKGFQFDDTYNPRQMKLPKTTVESIDCNLLPNTVISQQDLRGQLVQGLLWYRDENLAEAEAALIQATRLDPANPIAYHYLGKMLMEEKRFQEAELMLKKALDFALPYDRWIAYSDSVNRLSSGIPVDPCIETCFRDAYYRLGEDHFLLATLYGYWRRFDESEAHYRKFMETDPSNWPGYSGYAKMLEKAGRYLEAESVLTTYGNSQEKKGAIELIRFYAAVTEKFPGNGMWHLKAGSFYYDIAKKAPGHYENDKKTIDPLTGEPVYVEARRFPLKMFDMPVPRLVRFNEENKTAKLAGELAPFTYGILYLKQALDKIPDDEKLLADINSKIADLYVWQGLPDSAIYFYQAALLLDPGNTGTKNAIIEAYNSTFRFREAYEQLDSLLINGDLTRDKQLLLIRYAIQAGTLAKAAELLLRAAAVDQFIGGESRELLLLKGRFSARSNDIRSALRIYNSIYAQDKKDSTVMYTIARLHGIAGNRAETWKWLDMALRSGFNYEQVIRLDPALKMLHKTARWNKMLDAYAWKTYNSAADR